MTSANIGAYLADLKSRVSSVTVYNCIAKVRRVASLIVRDADFGLTLVTEAQRSTKDPLSRARGVRNGSMVALLAACPIRLKNFAGLALGKTFKRDQGNWWITLPPKSTKARRPDERRVHELLYPAIDLYVGQSRPALIGKAPDTGALWISSTTGRALTRKNLGILISRITLETVGVDVSPHLFRTAGASTSAMLAGEMPHLGSALLGHTDPRITEEHYRRASSIDACRTYTAIIQSVIEVSR